jgi:hypothetical protein
VSVVVQYIEAPLGGDCGDQDVPCPTRCRVGLPPVARADRSQSAPTAARDAVTVIARLEMRSKFSSRSTNSAGSRALCSISSFTTSHPRSWPFASPAHHPLVAEPIVGSSRAMSGKRLSEPVDHTAEGAVATDDRVHESDPRHPALRDFRRVDDKRAAEVGGLSRSRRRRAHGVPVQRIASQPRHQRVNVLVGQRARRGNFGGRDPKCLHQVRRDLLRPFNIRG